MDTSVSYYTLTSRDQMIWVGAVLYQYSQVTVKK